MSPAELAAALDEARDAVLSAPDPAGAARRLLRHVKRERQFSASPAALPIDDLAAARAGGHDIHTAANRRRVAVHG